MGKNKHARFAENETFSLLFQPKHDTVLKNDFLLKGKWRSDFFKNENPIILELGCGKGEYAINLAQRFPNKNFIGIDIKGARLWRGAKTATETNMSNVAFIRTRIDFIESFFAANEVDEIWITFPDPQIKYARRRLTSKLFLNRYVKFLKSDGRIHLKTDSQLLHEYTKALALHNNLSLFEANNDIYGSGRADELLSIKTHYEQLFLAENMPITYCCFSLENKTIFEEPEFDEKPFK